MRSRFGTVLFLALGAGCTGAADDVSGSAPNQDGGLPDSAPGEDAETGAETGADSSSPGDAEAGIDASPAFAWTNTLVGPPPAMSNPIIVRGLAGLAEFKTVYSPPNNVYPPGVLYWTSGAPAIPADADIVFDLRGETIREPIKVWNARHVWVIGGTFIPDPDVGGGVGQLANVNSPGQLVPNANLYPRIAGGNLLQVACSGTFRIEGVLMDAAGMNIDAIVGNSNPGQTIADARANKRFEVVNSRIMGYRGHLANDATYGDGLHADAFQMQSEQSSYNEMLIENVVIASGQEGIVANCIASKQPGSFHVRNFLAQIDTRYIDPDPTRRQYPLFLAANAADFSFDNAHVPHPQGWSTALGASYSNNFGFQHWYPPTLTYYTAPELAKGQLLAVPGIQLYGGTIANGDLGDPPSGTDFAPTAQVGAAYVSPWPVP